MSRMKETRTKIREIHKLLLQTKEGDIFLFLRHWWNIYMLNSDVHSVLDFIFNHWFSLHMVWSITENCVRCESRNDVSSCTGVPPIVHWDLNSATFGCKVFDFGLHHSQETVDIFNSVVGILFWLAPELVWNEWYGGTKADLYAYLQNEYTRKYFYHHHMKTWLKTLMCIGKEDLRSTIPDLPSMIREWLEDEPHKCVNLFWSSISMTRIKS